MFINVMLFVLTLINYFEYTFQFKAVWSFEQKLSVTNDLMDQAFLNILMQIFCVIREICANVIFTRKIIFKLEIYLPEYINYLRK